MEKEPGEIYNSPNSDKTGDIFDSGTLPHLAQLPWNGSMTAESMWQMLLWMEMAI